jgi:pyruvate formate lyase activating enzyme
MKEALYYTKLSSNSLKCCLCPHNCIIQEGKRGICKVRLNKEGVLFSEVYGYPVALNTDPVEKKPLYHYFPGYQVLSTGTLGCNLKCGFCQNCGISQASGEDQRLFHRRNVDEIIQIALQKQKNIGLAYTYNEPVIFYEFMTDLAREIHMNGLKNIMVSNGYINPEPLGKLLGLIDAFNIDLKSFEESFYKDHTKSNLQPVLQTIKTIFRHGNHLEITFLVIPGLNDDPEVFERMLDWIAKETSTKTVLHISRYFPKYNMNLPPTPYRTLENMYHIAKKKLQYVYLGNISTDNYQNTHCPKCNFLVIKRTGYYTVVEGLDVSGKCIKCGTEIISKNAIVS